MFENAVSAPEKRPEARRSIPIRKTCQKTSQKSGTSKTSRIKTRIGRGDFI
jgi:hypothetical protein